MRQILHKNSVTGNYFRGFSRTKRHCTRTKQRQRNVQKRVLHEQICFLLIRSIDFVAVLIAVTA